MEEEPNHGKIQISIDRGGTFTDIHASIPGRKDIILKLLSVDPSNYKDAPTEGIRRILELFTGSPYPRGQPLDLSAIERIRMGTTVGTNALLERKGARSALFITKGFKDLLRIGTQSRPKIFDLTVKRPELLYESVIEVDERVTIENFTEDARPKSTLDTSADPALCLGVTGEPVRVLKTVDMAAVTKDLQRIWDEGYRSLSIVLLHSYLYPEHERAIGEAASSMGFAVVQSSTLQPMIKAVMRGTSATADAYLTPVVKEYIDSISTNFEGGLVAGGTRCEFMQSDGGLVDFRGFGGLRSILSGPAGGVVGYAQSTYDAMEKKPVIGFDMGGTSTDVSRYAGAYEHVFETTTAGISIQSPQLDISTVAAGGGSMLFWRDGLFVVGPESAGAHPGPACYRKGGPLTITDANLFLGKINAEYFPKIFGPNEDEALGSDIVAQKFAALAEVINRDNQHEQRPQLTPEEIAWGFLKVADEVMARPIRDLTEARGYDTSSHMLACFGGAGGQHACSLAKSLSISRVVIHNYASILSAYGLSLADVVHEVQRPAALEYRDSNFSQIRETLESMRTEVTESLMSQGMTHAQISHEVYLNMRYRGSSTSLMILQRPDTEVKDFVGLFETRHSREFGFSFPEKQILIDDFRVRGIASSSSKAQKSPHEQMQAATQNNVSAPSSHDTTPIYLDATLGRVQVPMFVLSRLKTYTVIQGPAQIVDKTLTIIVPPKSVATVLETCVVIDLKPSEDLIASAPQEQEVNPIQLSIYGHRFMSIAEQMGNTLQKTAVSTNIKERLDFSCALFSPDGGLVANAPHVPVHLGSMQFAVKYQHEFWRGRGRLRDGDVLVTNHPSCGGTHLPDVTVITPVFQKGEIVFYVASRGHHADIGGTLPGSMPSNSTRLSQEGAAIEAEKLVENGVFNEEMITRLLLHEPAKHAGSSGTRCLKDNLSDLAAQVAANNKGIHLIQSLIDECSLQEVQKYMYAIQDTAETAVRNLLKRFHAEGKQLKAIDYMDDGTPIALSISIDGATGSATFDFSGTGPQVYGNTNAPVAITHSAIIYCLRSLVASDIPLNQGCLNPITITIPPHSLLSPSKETSVVGGNVLTSQRITDVVLKAFGACADSQGCMNNLTFGMGGNVAGEHVAGFGYYETIGGGAGAGPTWNGQSGVHTHMTNTLITDPEVFEKRYPCILREFSIRDGSGGAGLMRGGDGIVRDIQFTEQVQVSILSERRSRAPAGAHGGENGAMGVNLWVQKDKVTGEEKVTSLGGKASTEMKPGDRIVINTPGGGGWGKAAREVSV